MDRYKFRGKRLDNGEWVEGYYVHQELANKHFIVTENASLENPYTPSYFTYNEVDQSSAGQYTGLKDKNSVEIYEWDILDGSWVNPMSQEEVKRHYLVTFNKGKYNAELIGHHPYGSTMLYFENEKAEVIGSVHDNKELLEG